MFDKLEHSLLGKLSVQDNAAGNYQPATGNIGISVTNDSIEVDKSWQWNGTLLHCKKKINRNNAGITAQNIVIYSNYIKIEYSDNSNSIIQLPKNNYNNYGPELIQFSDEGGLITLDNIPNNSELEYSDLGVKLKAVGGGVNVEGFDQKERIHQNQDNKNVVAFIGYYANTAILFDDGTAKKIFHTHIAIKDHAEKLQSKLRDELVIVRNNYLETILDVDVNAQTADGYNVKEVLYGIDKYLHSSWFAGHKANDQLQQKHTYEALTAMIKNPSKAIKLVNQSVELHPKTSPGKNVAIGILLLIAAGVLIGVGVVNVTILVPFTAGACGVIGFAAFGCAAALITAAGFRFNRARVDHKYNRNIKFSTKFFDDSSSQPSSSSEDPRTVNDHDTPSLVEPVK